MKCKVTCQLSNCSKNPCKNGAKCMEQPGTSYGYSCSCLQPFMGVNCDQRSDQSEFKQSKLVSYFNLHR